jgi:hypothetical protein
MAKLIKSKADEEKTRFLSKNKFFRILRSRLLSIKFKFFRLLFKAFLRIKAYLKRIKKLILQENFIQNLKKSKLQDDIREPHKHIPTVLKDTMDLENKLNHYLNENQEVMIGKNYSYETIEKSKIYSSKKQSIQTNSEKTSDHDLENSTLNSNKISLSFSSIDKLTSEILKNHKVRSYLEREIERVERRAMVVRSQNS